MSLDIECHWHQIVVGNNMSLVTKYHSYQSFINVNPLIIKYSLVVECQIGPLSLVTIG